MQANATTILDAELVRLNAAGAAAAHSFEDGALSGLRAVANAGAASGPPELESLRNAVHIGMDLGNHHNAALCPYCSPKSSAIETERDAAESKADAMEAELESWRTGRRRASWPRLESVPDGLHYAAELVRAQGAEPGEEHDALLRNASYRLKKLHDAVGPLLAERNAAKAEVDGLTGGHAEFAKHASRWRRETQAAQARVTAALAVSDEQISDINVVRKMRTILLESVSPETDAQPEELVETVARLSLELATARRSFATEQHARMVDVAKAQTDAEEAEDAIPGFWRGRCANEDNPDDEGTNLMPPVTVLAEHLDAALDGIQSVNPDDAANIGYPDDIRRATWEEIQEWLTERDARALTSAGGATS